MNILFFMLVMFPFDAKQIHSVYAYYWDLLDIFGFPRHHPVFVFLFRLDIATYWIYLLQTQTNLKIVPMLVDRKCVWYTCGNTRVVQSLTLCLLVWRKTHLIWIAENKIGWNLCKSTRMFNHGLWLVRGRASERNILVTHMDLKC